MPNYVRLLHDHISTDAHHVDWSDFDALMPVIRLATTPLARNYGARMHWALLAAIHESALAELMLISS